MEFAVISMGKVGNKYPVLEHCCYGLSEKKTFPVEVALFYFALKQKGFKTKFFDGNLVEEGTILEELKKDCPKNIIYHLYTPYIRHKKEFMKKLSQISNLYLVITPFFWRSKILKEFPFVKDVFYDGEKGFGIDVSKTKINYDEMELEPYLKDSSFSVVISKYCPYQCTYCNAKKTGLMDRNLDIVRGEIEYLRNKGIKKFRLCGNNLTINKKKFIELCKIMKELDVKWSGDGRVNHMTDEMYSALEGANGTLLFGVESANQKILNNMKKGITIEQVIKNADELNKRKILFRYTFMFGFPWDSRETAEEMIALRKKVGALNYHCNFLTIYPGNPIFEEMKQLKLIDESKLDFEDFTWLKAPLSGTLYLSKGGVVNIGKKIMTRGIFDKRVIKNVLKNTEFEKYPRLFLRGLKIISLGKRTWVE